MNQQQQQPMFVMMPQMANQQQQTYSDQRPPMRVMVALGLLHDLTAKTAQTGMVNEVGFECVPGQELCSAERVVQAAACHLINDYFMGKLVPDVWEKDLLDRNKKVRSKTMGGKNNPGIVLRCISCAPGPIQPNCPICEGSGQLLCFPTS